MTVFFLLLLILSEVLLPNYTCASRVRRQNMKVRISAIGNTIMLKFLQEDMDTKLEGYILGYGSNMFSRQFIQLPENGEPFETEIDAEPKYLIAVQPLQPSKEEKIKKQCADKETPENPLHLVIGSVSPTSVILSWSTILNNPYTDTNVDDCIEDGQYTVRYREKEPNTNWLYQTCPTTTTVIDQLKPDTPYEFGVRAETETISGDWSAPVTHNTEDTHEPQLPYLKPITETPQVPTPSLPIQQSVTQSRPAPLLRQTAPPPIPKTTPDDHEPQLPYQQPITEGPEAPMSSQHSVTQSRPPPLLRETTPTPVPKMTPDTHEPQLPYLKPITETPQVPTPSLPNVPEPQLPYQKPSTEGPEAPIPLKNSVTQSRPPPLLRETTPTPIPKMTPGTRSDAIATSPHSEDPLFLTQTSSFTHTTVNLPPPKTTSISEPKSHIIPSITSTNKQQLYIPQYQLITGTDKIILSKVADQLNVTNNLQSVSNKTKSQPKNVKSQPKTSKSKIRTPRPNTVQLKDKKAIHQSKKKQPKHTTFHPQTIKSQSTTTQTQVHTTQSFPHITHSQSTTTQSQARTAQSPSHITKPQPTTTQSPAHTTQSSPHITQSQPTTIHSQPNTSPSQHKYQTKKTRPRVNKQHKTSSDPTKAIQPPNINPRTPKLHKHQSWPITSDTLTNTTISQPTTVKYQSRTIQPRPITAQSQFSTTHANTPQTSKQTQSSGTEKQTSTTQPLTTRIYQHVPTQPKSNNRQTNFTLPQSLPIKDQASKVHQPTLSYQKPAKQRNQVLSSPNTVQITSVQGESFTSISETDIQEDRASLHTSAQHPTYAAKLTISPIRDQDWHALSTTETDTKTRTEEPVSTTKFEYQPNFHTTPWKSDKPGFTTISEPQITNRSYSATKQNVRKEPFEKVKLSSKYNRNKNLTLTEKNVVRKKLPGRKPGRVNSSSSVVNPSSTTMTQTTHDEKHKGLLQPMPSKEPSKKLELQGNVHSPIIWKKSDQVGKKSEKEEGKKQSDTVLNEVLKPQAAPITEKPVYVQPEPTTTRFFAFNGSRFDTGDNSSVFSSVPVSTVDAQGKKRYVAPSVIYKTDKPPDEPCSVTQSLSYFPEEESLPINVTGPPRIPPSNLTVVTVEGCPSFVILDWKKAGNETTEYEVVSSKKDAKGGELFVITTNQTHTAVENLKPNSSYEFRVTPKNELGSGPPSEPVSFSTESADPRVSEIPTGKNAIWSSFSFKTDSYSECTGTMYVKRTWYRKFVGIQLCNSLRYKIYLSDSLKGKFYNIGDEAGYGEDHCQFVDSFLDGRTGGPLLPHQLPPKQGFYRGARQEPVKFGKIGGNTRINYVAWYECGVPIPGSW